jgi:thiol:disulfide interchange protein DsbD
VPERAPVRAVSRLLASWASVLALALAVGAASAGTEDPLDPEEAFRFSARALDARTMEARWVVAPGHYLYRDKFRFAVAPGEVVLGAAIVPAGRVKDDPYFGRVETHEGEVAIRVPLTVSQGSAREVILSATSQGCAAGGVCYPPLVQQATLVLPAGTGPGTAAPDPAPAASGDESSQAATLLADAGIWTVLLFFFVSGITLSLTPCVLPMVPILSGIIVGHGHDIGRGRAFVLSAAYVAGMAIAYAAFGVAAGLSGSMLSSALQNAWVLGGFAALFVVLSLSMFGLYELQLPASLQGRLSDHSNRRKGGSFKGVMAMGAISAVIVGPCVAAPLAGALLYIAKTGDAVLGGLALFVMALGMGVPLLAVATSARHLLPKSGPWMTTVRHIFGVVLLGLAIWIVSPVLPAVMQMVAWAALLIFSAVYLRAIDPLPDAARGWSRFGKGVGVVALLLGSSLLLGALAGHRDALQPLAFLKGAAAAERPAVTFERVASVEDLEARLKAATTPVMLDVYADWCVSCKEMERFTFSDPDVARRLAGLTLLKADVTANSEEDKRLLKRLGLFGPPGIVFFDAKGVEVPGSRVIGFVPAGPFGQRLALAGR